MKIESYFDKYEKYYQGCQRTRSSCEERVHWSVVVPIKSPVSLKTKMDRRELFDKRDLSVICIQEMESQVYER